MCWAHFPHFWAPLMVTNRLGAASLDDAANGLPSRSNTGLCKDIPINFQKSLSKCSTAHPKIALWSNISSSRNLDGMFLHYSVHPRYSPSHEGLPSFFRGVDSPQLLQFWSEAILERFYKDNSSHLTKGNAPLSAWFIQEHQVTWALLLTGHIGYSDCWETE